MATLFAFARQPMRAGTPRFSSMTARATAFVARRHFSNYVVTPTELHEAIRKNPPSKISTDPRTIPVCASWFLPNDGRTGIQTYREQRIPKARFFDLDKVIDKHSPYPHMLPDAKTFALTMSELGIRKDDVIVVYDTKELGIFSAPRAAWTMRLFGHPRVHILDNFKQWVEQGLPTESGELYTVECSQYQIPKEDEIAHGKVASYEDVREITYDYNKEGAEGIQILDARSAGRFAGTAPEPREGLSSGHMPGAINIPFNELLDAETKTFKSPEELKKYFAAKGVDPEKPVVSSCGTGVTACVVDTGLEIAGYGSPKARKVYDGSWTEWAQRVRPSDNLIIKDQ
ncbi:Rhodanese-like domain-containing protein [Emericellopsis atlantica]|uniref:Rhodanese-like domain-containing protein n=1 Tax=Emericellopsis atlantica TaxID=2614577 RepID=A0A9P7ZQ23_9HYPO|nr:Rhodanese-like domain-containing protein [Emericellopsis atlantica]KAG9256090.1 Rhodanese-like domain-containing protein [Emericellopsis atlantica]